jgi:hypothetical protein
MDLASYFLSFMSTLTVGGKVGFGTFCTMH